MIGWLRLAMTMAGAALAFSQPAAARKQAPPPPPPPAPVIPQVHSGDASIDAFYYYDRQGRTMWLSSADGRAAATRVANILKRAPADGLADGPVLAAKVEVAIQRGTLEDDAIISDAWSRYVRALRSPVAGVDYGDPGLQLVAPRTKQVLLDVQSAPAMLAHVDKVASVNPFYSTLRDAAITAGTIADPRVKGTLDRLRLIPVAGKVIVVDTASQRLMMVEDGRVVDTMKVVVGKLQSPTPNIAGTIHYVTLNPYWNIPIDVVQHKVAPIVVKRGTKYLSAARYESTDKWGSAAEKIDPASVDWKAVAAGETKAYLRQLPGSANMMGKMKFGFVNSGDIFLHDTPRKALFDKETRALSMGCVRLEHADRLALWLLGRDPEPDGAAPEQQVALEKGVPVFTTSLTANVDNGQVVFANDLYGLDQPPSAQAAVEPSAPAIPAADPDSSY